MENTLYILNIEYVNFLHVKNLTRFVSQKKKKRIQNFLNENDKITKLFSELLIRKIVMEQFNIINNGIKLKYNINEKPYLDIENFFFNISDSKNYCICGVSNKNVGVDIEFIDKKINIDIAKRFFSRNESNDILSSKNKRDVFFKYWCLKESFLKLIGTGFSQSLNSFSITNKLNNYNLKFENKDYDFELIENFRNLKIAICQEKQLEKFRMINISANEIVDFFEKIS